MNPIRPSRSRYALLLRLATLAALALPPLPALAQGYKVGEGVKPAAPATGAAASRHFRKIAWEDLAPASWDPAAAFKGVDLDKLKDGDPKAQALLDKLKAEWARAPVNPQMNGAAVRIPGFMVPLENSGGKVREFLLVPYFGACIHTPPPPANQIIHVRSATPYAGRSMDTVWVSGTLETVKSDTLMGSSAYRMQAARVEAYTAR